LTDVYRVLVVDDDHEIAAAIAKLLDKNGYLSQVAHDGFEALEVMAASPPHLMILDIMMPRLDGLTALMKIREYNNIPILLLSAKTEDSDKILGLGMGADDYVTKPFVPSELLARVQSHLRRYFTLGNHESSPTQIVNGRLCLALGEKQLLVDGEPVRLTATEYKIVELLMRHPGQVFSAERIYEAVWNDAAHAVENTVMVHIRRIREKIEINPREPEYLKVVWGIGYKIEKNTK